KRGYIDSGIGNNYEFTGKERDPEDGLDEFGARRYTWYFSRFTTTDPKQISKHRMLNPQQWNMYSYALNNPLHWVDPDGKEPLPSILFTWLRNYDVLVEQRIHVLLYESEDPHVTPRLRDAAEAYWRGMAEEQKGYPIRTNTQFGIGATII